MSEGSRAIKVIPIHDPGRVGEEVEIINGSGPRFGGRLAFRNERRPGAYSTSQTCRMPGTTVGFQSTLNDPLPPS